MCIYIYIVNYKVLPLQHYIGCQSSVTLAFEVAIEADQMAFQLYKGGVLTQECGPLDFKLSGYAC